MAPGLFLLFDVTKRLFFNAVKWRKTGHFKTVKYVYFNVTLTKTEIIISS